MYTYLNNCTASGLKFSEVSKVKCNRGCNAIKLTKLSIKKLIPPQNSFNF